MAIYKCTICGMIYDEQEQGKPLSSLDACPICKQPISKFEKILDSKTKQNTKINLMYDASLSREDKNNRYMKEIHEMAVKGESLHSAMATEMPLPSWDDILIMGAQLNPMPLNDQDPVSLKSQWYWKVQFTFLICLLALYQKK